MQNLKKKAQKKIMSQSEMYIEQANFVMGKLKDVILQLEIAFQNEVALPNNTMRKKNQITIEKHRDLIKGIGELLAEHGNLHESELNLFKTEQLEALKIQREEAERRQKEAETERRRKAEAERRQKENENSEEDEDLSPEERQQIRKAKKESQQSFDKEINKRKSDEQERAYQGAKNKKEKVFYDDDVKIHIPPKKVLGDSWQEYKTKSGKEECKSNDKCTCCAHYLIHLAQKYFPSKYKEVDVTDFVTLKKIYRDLAKIFHPDKGGTKEKFQDLSNCDPEECFKQKKGTF